MASMKRFLTWRNARITMWIIALLVGGYTIQRVKEEGQIRQEQFCQLVVGEYTERVTRLRGTEDFLASPAGQDPDPLTDYIRQVSLPQTRDELAKERENLPKVCLPLRSEDG